MENEVENAVWILGMDRTIAINLFCVVETTERVSSKLWLVGHNQTQVERSPRLASYSQF